MLAISGWTRSAGVKSAGERGRCLLTISHGLVGSVRENCGASLIGGAGVVVAVDVAEGVGVGSGVVLPAGGVPVLAADDGPGAGVQADRTPSPAATARKRVKERLLQLWHT